MQINCKREKAIETGYYNAKKLIEKAEREDNKTLLDAATKELKYFSQLMRDLGKENRG